MQHLLQCACRSLPCGSPFSCPVLSLRMQSWGLVLRRWPQAHMMDSCCVACAASRSCSVLLQLHCLQPLQCLSDSDIMHLAGRTDTAHATDGQSGRQRPAFAGPPKPSFSCCLLVHLPWCNAHVSLFAARPALPELIVPLSAIDRRRHATEPWSARHCTRP